MLKYFITTTGLLLACSAAHSTIYTAGQYNSDSSINITGNKPGTSKMLAVYLDDHPQEAITPNDTYLAADTTTESPVKGRSASASANLTASTYEYSTDISTAYSRETANNSDWAVVTRVGSSSNIQADLFDSTQKGKIKFNIDYSFDQIGSEAYSSVFFWAYLPGSNSYISFYDGANGSTSNHIAGTWTSEWLEYDLSGGTSELTSHFQFVTGSNIYEDALTAPVNIQASSMGWSKLTIETAPAAPVPEPETYALFGIGLLCAIARRRFHKK